MEPMNGYMVETFAPHKVLNTKLKVFSRGDFFAQNITDSISELVDAGRIANGEVTILGMHTTSAVMLIEYEAGVLYDLRKAFEEIAPSHGDYAHHIRKVDRNGRGHALSALFNRSLTVSIENGHLVLGTYQDIVFMDFQDLMLPRYISIRIKGVEHEHDF